MLARLANETGGRMTRGSNDFSLGYARAQRDLGCKYTIGFYLRPEHGSRPRQITVDVRQPGLRALHPERYRLPSKCRRRRLLLLVWPCVCLYYLPVPVVINSVKHHAPDFSIGMHHP